MDKYIQCEKSYVELVNLSREAVEGYERYLMDKLSSKNLAKIMKRLQEVLPDEDRDRRET